MATIDDRFICTSDLDTYYVDQSSGEPMSGGIVIFYSDVNRTTLKPVYQLTGTTGNYSYAPLPNPCTLSNVGTFQDALGNNVVPYYYPFTGTPDQNTGIQELYYIKVVNSGLVPQFTRQGWPQAAAEDLIKKETNIENLIPNGQFIANNNAIAALGVNVQPYVQYAFGAETVNAQPIAQGGWNFVYDNNTTSTFNNSFSLIPSSGGWGLPSYPRYVFNFVCASNITPPATQDLRIQWPDIYKFSTGTPTFNLFFNAKSNDNNTYTFTLYQIFYYGSGGSPSAPIVNQIGTITVTGSYQNYNFQIQFPFATGTLGTNGDDYVALSIRGPTSSYNVQFSDFVMYEGNTALTDFPIQTNANMLSEGVAGWMPSPATTGNDLYLPLILTPQGTTFDHSQVGKIEGNLLPFTTVNGINYGVNNLLYCDGQTLLTSGYSYQGVPFSRLQSILFDSGTQTPRFGTGSNFAQININSGATSQMILGTNAAGSVTNPADGTTGTTFTFTTTAPLSNAGHAAYNYKCYANGQSIVTFISTFANGTNGAALFAAGTSGMTFTNYGDGLSGPLFAATAPALTAAALANTGSAGKYFTFSDHSTNYYVWFFVSNETDPAPGGTGIRCNLISTMGTLDVANIIARVVSGQQTNAISTVAGSSVPAGSWFNFFAGSGPTEYSVWYQVAGLPTTAPAVPGTAIIVALLGTETAAQVATKTQAAINGYSFAVPDLRGVFLRGSDPFGQWDLDYQLRWVINNTIDPRVPGSFEFESYQVHHHTAGGSNSFIVSGPPGVSGGSGTSWNAVNVTGSDGNTETRPVNMWVNYYIRF